MFDILQGSTAFAVLRSHHIAKFVPGTPSRGNCFTVTVGRKISRAQYFLDDPREVRRMLNLLAERSSMGGGLQQAAREGHANLPSSISLQSLSVQSASSVSE
uniref:Trehalose-6-phosphate synthase like protein n=1 Tax=Nannochloropsis gaditana (strain CCMP526) TaxID=1093141 RepID=I2CQ63_NANGC